MNTPNNIPNKAVDIVTNANMPYRGMTSKEWINKITIGEI